MAQTRASADNAALADIFDIGHINSIMVLQGDDLILEEYRQGMQAERTTNIKSASKSLLALLVGVAIEEGYLEGVDQPIGPFFADYFARHPDPEKESITIGNLLTMQAGLGSTSQRNYGAWVLSDSWVDYALQQPMTEERGGRMIYSTGTSHLLSVILTEASGMSTREFAERYLFDPMGIRIGGWDRDPEGYYFGGNNLALSPRSLLKLGELVINRGEYDGQQLVAADWIDAALGKYTRSNFNPYDFGYMWWHQPVGDYAMHFAWGNGGQYILIFPQLDAVAAITSTPDVPGSSRDSRQQLFRFIEARLIPFLESNASAKNLRLDAVPLFVVLPDVQTLGLGIAVDAQAHQFVEQLQ